MNPKRLYDLFCHEAETEGFQPPPWDSLSPGSMIVWGKLYRRLASEHGLDRSGVMTREQIEAELSKLRDRLI